MTAQVVVPVDFLSLAAEIDPLGSVENARVRDMAAEFLTTPHPSPTWTTTRPTVAGAYWLREDGDANSRWLADVSDLDGELNIADYGSIDMLGPRTEWLGPLVPAAGRESALGSNGWIPFAERWPEKSPALDDPSVLTMDAVLVTNNLSALDRMGRMSHVWYAAPMESSNGEIVAFDEADRKIRGLTHWRDAGTKPLGAIVPSTTGKDVPAAWLAEEQGYLPGDGGRELWWKPNPHHKTWKQTPLYTAPQQPASDKFAATFRCESNGIIGTTNAPIHSVTMHDDGVIEVVIDHWPQQPAAVDGARPLDEWHEDDGPVVWWKSPVDEPAWIGTPLDSDWPGYHTHWTPHPAVPALATQHQEPKS